MTASNIAATQAVAYAFIDAQFPWLPKPTITEWNNINGGSQYYATDQSISVPKYSDQWNDGRKDIVIHEVGHVLVYHCAIFGEVLTPFLAAMGADPALRQHPLINEIIAEHFARAYVEGYVGSNRPELVGLAPFDAEWVRAFFRSLASSISTPRQNTQPAGAPKVLAAIPPLDPPAIVVDYFSPKGAEFMACLRENGVSGIARYLTNSPSDQRQITREEVAAAHAAGLSVHFFFEMNPTYAGYFTYAQGGQDCRDAIDRLRELGAPEGTVVYFAVDVNVEPSIADGYFNAVEWNVTPQIVPGVYGFERMVQYARQYYPNIGQHLAQTYGAKRGALDLWQNRQDALCGVSVDFNECAADGWRAPKEVEVTDEEFIEKTRRLITPTLDAMKTAYDPLIVAARANGLIDATQEAHLAALDTRLAKLREV